MAYISLFHYIHAYTVFKLELKLNELRGGPLDILGRGVADPKKKFMQGVGPEIKIPAST
jgi:hypothetical protein